MYELILSNGLFFDGRGGPPRVRHLGIRDGRVADISESPLTPGPGTRVIDATGRWVMPGLRWYTVMANDRPRELESIVSHPDVLIGFSDAGAHLRNMAHYNFPLRMLRLVREAEKRGEPVMPMEHAVHRLTGEIADWLGLDVGTLAPGRRADVVVVDPERLGAGLDEPREASMEGFDGFVRLVNQNGGAVETVLINGRLAVHGGETTPELGRERGFGRVLRVPGPLTTTPRPDPGCAGSSAR